VIPVSHVLLLALMHFIVGLIGLLTRRSGMVVLVSATIMLGGVLLALNTGSDDAAFEDLQSAGVVVLAVMAGLALTGGFVLYAFHGFRRSVALDEHEGLKH
jgi:NADH:ubiquinone oxidoreductase subunit K